MDVTVYRDGQKFELHFEKGNNVGGLRKEPTNSRQTGTTQKWRPDLEVFTDIDIPLEYYQTVLRKQAVVNAGLKFLFFDEDSGQKWEYKYEHGIVDYIKEISKEQGFTSIQFYETQTGT